MNNQILAGKTIVFTGKMEKVRWEMEMEAKSLGAVTEPRVTSRTDLLVTGSNVGQTKLDAAEKNGCRVMSESDYRKVINDVAGKTEGNTEQGRSARSPSRPLRPEWIDKLRGNRSIRF